MTILHKLIISFLGLACAAMFAGFENGIVSIRKARLDHAVEQGDRLAKIIKFLLDRPAIMLATVLLGTNLSYSVAAIFFDESIKAAANSGSVPLPISPILLSATAAALLTIIVLIFCEITPKVWFRQHPFPRCRLAVVPVFLFFLLAYPVVWLLTAIVHLMHKLFPQGFGSDVVLMREDFRLMLRESEEHGLITEEGRMLLENSLEHDRHTVHAIKVPRDAVHDVSTEDSLYDVLALARQCDMSRFPVYEPNNPGDWIGTISIYDAIYRIARKDWQTATVREYMRPLVYVSDTDNARMILQTSRKTRTPLLIVVDPGGAQTGIVTPSDFVRPLFGDLDLSPKKNIVSKTS